MAPPRHVWILVLVFGAIGGLIVGLVDLSIPLFYAVAIMAGMPAFIAYERWDRQHHS